LWSLFALSVVISLYYANKNLTADFYSPLTRAWELLAGSLLAVYARKPLSLASVNSRSPYKNYASIVAFLCLLIALYFIDKTKKFPGAWAFFPVAVGVGFILAGPKSWLNQHILASKPFVWVGLISYPLYLWHWPLLVLGHHYFGTEFDWKIKVFAIALAVVLSALCYYLLETPIRKAKKTSSLIVKVLLIIAVILAYLGYSVYNKQGYPKRFPSIIQQLTTAQGNLQDGWRVNKCMLEYEQRASQYASECVQTNPKPHVFLWGDSHAGSLYPGLLALQKNSSTPFALSQRTGAMCPSLLDTEMRPLCKELNNSTIEVIRQTKPDIVVLYSLWSVPQYDMNQLSPTIKALKEAGVKKIVMLGVPVMWEGSLPHHIVSEWREGPPLVEPAQRSWRGVGKDLPALDAKVAKIADQAGVEYISMHQLLCNEQGCLTRPSLTSSAPMSFDYGHLTIPAATYIAEQIAPKILSLPK
jgi:hypothetical protein